MFAPAVVSAFLLVAVPTALFMAVWTCVTMMRILFPERDALPFSRRKMAEHRGRSVPVRAYDIVEDIQSRPHVALPERAPVSGGELEPRGGAGLYENLWARRN